MEKKALIALIALLAYAALVGCGSSQAELDAQATQIAAGIFATQTAEVPTRLPTAAATSTPAPSPTQIPSPTTTNTNTPTFTPIPTLTPSPTPLPPTPTPTIIPPTVSAESVQMVLEGEPWVQETLVIWPSTSVVWIEPGPTEGTIVLLSEVPPEYLEILGLSELPENLGYLDISPLITTSGLLAGSFFRYGAVFYGAVTGPVEIAG